jgi:hypothetical protein
MNGRLGKLETDILLELDIAMEQQAMKLQYISNILLELDIASICKLQRKAMLDRNCAFNKNRCQQITAIIYEYYDIELSQIITLFLVKCKTKAISILSTS